MDKKCRILAESLLSICQILKNILENPPSVSVFTVFLFSYTKSYSKYLFEIFGYLQSKWIVT